MRRDLAQPGLLSRFAAPFLARMDFLDEDGASTSPTLEALRAYRELRAAGHQKLLPDAPVDFVSKALEPLVRCDGAIDRRREELRPIRVVLPAGRGVAADP